MDAKNHVEDNLDLEQRVSSRSNAEHLVAMKRRIIAMLALLPLGLFGYSCNGNASKMEWVDSLEIPGDAVSLNELMGESVPGETGERVPVGDESVTVVASLPIRVTSLTISRDDTGGLGVLLGIAIEDRGRMGSWTQARIGKRMLFILGGEPIAIATINRELRGPTIYIDSRASFLTDEEISHLIARFGEEHGTFLE